MKLQNRFAVPVPAAEAWAILTDVPRIAPCLPGAELTELVGDGVYKGRIAVRLGPVALSFDGTVRFVEMDAAARVARVKAQGTDAKGRGGANAEAVFRVEPTGETCRVTVDTDLTLSGAVAQYGRGSAMVNELANQIVGQFADCLGQQIAARRAAPAAAPGATGPEPTPAAAAPLAVLPLLARSLWRVVAGLLRRLIGR